MTLPTTRSFRKILIANRGEIAMRVLRTCRAMGIVTIGVYSDADAHSPYVRFVDEAVHIGAAESRESYLNISKVIDAAKRTGADAIHPGYGFLSENADFADACAAEGIIFIGPSPQAIRQMGLKSTARRMMAKVGVPVVPGYDDDDQSVERLRAQILKIGFPVLIKASAGGGGKGMHLVREGTDVSEAIESARREAEKAFGNGSLLLERYIDHARHVEVQIIGDSRGNLVHLFERDCSLQRRHQKIIEEGPSPAVNDDLRQRMAEAAVKAGRAIGYNSAGTVEFVLAPTGEFYFIEVNTRLQVEHPVTEMVTGLDLVKLQIEIAEGKPLTFAQPDLRMNGHAIEARLYAEDPGNNFLPATGKILEWQLPTAIEGLRIDAGVERGSEVGIYYDPMLAKLIAYADTREAAIRKLVYALRSSSIQGIQTNLDLLIRLLEHPEFCAGKAHTGLIAEHFDTLTSDHDEELNSAALIAIALYIQKQCLGRCDLLGELPPSYRNNPFRDPAIRLRVGRHEVRVSWHHIAGESYEVKIEHATSLVEVLDCEQGSIRLAIDGIQRRYTIVEAGDQIYVHSSLGSQTVIRLPRYPIRQSDLDQGSANSPMPGQVLKVLIEEGQNVSAGDPLLVLEAMKMEHTMRAAIDGIVKSVLVKTGEVVGPGQRLVQIERVLYDRESPDRSEDS